MIPYLNCAQNQYSLPLNYYQQVPYQITPFNSCFYVMMNPVSGINSCPIVAHSELPVQNMTQQSWTQPQNNQE